MEYDVCVVGAGISGLVAANKLIDEGKNVIVLEQHNAVGGISTNRVKGRFEFKFPTLDLYVNNSNLPYSINNLLDNDIEFVGLRNILRVMSPKGDITLVNDKEKTLEILESLAPNSGEPLRNFISLAEECREALDYITKNIDN